MKKIVLSLFTILFFSCASRKDVVYCQNIDSLARQEKSNSYIISIQLEHMEKLNKQLKKTFEIKAIEIAS